VSLVVLIRRPPEMMSNPKGKTEEEKKINPRNKQTAVAFR
jgi:hypothetical protein